MNKNQKKTQNLKRENNKSTKLFINEDKINRNRILKRENDTEKKVEKKIFEKNINININKEFNSIEFTPRKNPRVKTREKKNKNNLNINNFYSNNNNQNSKIINLESNSNPKKKNILKFCSNSPKTVMSKRKNSLNESDSDLISISEFMNVLENTKKNQPMKITLNDLYNYQFNSEENKILDTTSATTSLLKLDNGLLSMSEMYLLYKSENNNKNNNEKNYNDNVINDLCDEFTVNEKKEKNLNLVNNNHKLNYIDKIQQNKKEFEKIEGMQNFELMKNSEICKTEYKKCLEEIKKYSGIINLEILRKSYKNIKNLTDEELNNVLEDMVIKIKKKLPKNKAEKIAEDLYNLIYYENKYELIKRTIKKNK